MFKNINKILPVSKVELFKTETSYVIKINQLKNILTILKNHFNYQSKVLTCISAIDNTKNLYRFQIIYELLSLMFNARIRVKTFTDELTPIESVEKIYTSADWWEREIWDMCGVFFNNKKTLTRLLTDYGFEGFPLRKNFPLTGYNELRFNSSLKRTVYEEVNLSQKFQNLNFVSAWYNYKLNIIVFGEISPKIPDK